MADMSQYRALRADVLLREADDMLRAGKLCKHGSDARREKVAESHRLRREGLALLDHNSVSK